MTEVNRKIHVIGINSYKFEDLSFKLQNLFLETENIAVPNSYFEEIKSWRENDLKKKSFFSSKSNNELLNWLKSQKSDVILISRGDPLWFGIGRILLKNFSKDELSFYPSNTCIQLAFINSPFISVSATSALTFNGLIENEISNNRGNIPFKNIFLFDFVIFFIFRIHQSI